MKAIARKTRIAHIFLTNQVGQIAKTSRRVSVVGGLPKRTAAENAKASTAPSS